jgi:hypothetical protein
MQACGSLMNKLCLHCQLLLLIPTALPFNAWVRGRSLAEIVGSNLAVGMDVCLL